MDCGIIDFHTHNFPDELAPRAVDVMVKKLRGCLLPVGDGTLATQLADLDKSGVSRAVVCPIATKPTQFQVILDRAKAMRDGVFGEEAAKRLIQLCSVHPADRNYAANLKEIADAGFKGIKVHPYYQDFDLSDPAVRPMFAALSDAGLVVQCHCGYDIGYPGRYDACGPREIEVLLKNVRPLKFIAAHLGGCRGFAPHATDALLECGCHIDTSALHRDWHCDEQMRLLRSWPTERLLFGTDFPWVHYPEALRWVRTYRAPEDHAAVLGGNAARLLGL